MSKTAHELTRKEMKGPDQFQQVAARVTSWMAARQKQLAVAGVVVLAAALCAVVVSYLLEARQLEAAALLSTALETAGGEVAAEPTPGVRFSFKTQEEKDRAVLVAAAKVRARAGGSRAGATAALLEGDAHLALKEWDPAMASYQAYLAGIPKDEPLRYAGLDGLARAQEAKGDLAAAASTWQQATSIAAFKDNATLEEARALAKAGKADEARKLLGTVPESSPLQGEAQERLARLGGK